MSFQEIPAAAFRTVAVDYDGVIHRYGRGFLDGSCYDVPMPGAIEALDALRAVRPVAVFTARPTLMVVDWFDVHAPHLHLYADVLMGHDHWSDQERILVTNRKIVAQHYIDDRAIRFATWPDALHDIGVFDRAIPHEGPEQPISAKDTR